MDSLTIFDFSDRELLWMVDDYADAEGWTSIYAVAKALDLQTVRPAASVGVRLGLLRRRTGALERHPTQRKYKLTPFGERILHAKLNGRESRVFDDMPREKMLLATRALSGRFRLESPETATFMRREWTYGTSSKSRV